MQPSTPKVYAARVEIEDTIDGVDRAAIDPAPVRTQTGEDYPELVEVDRTHYAITGEIAKGGMGRVLDARDLRLGRDVAIKELLPRNRDAAHRFEREARITARLQHPSIIHVYEAGVWAGGEPFYAMTKVAGRSFDKVIAERATLAGRLALLPHVISIADALAYAHSENVIHRDLKPSNVLVGEFGETVVIDWGLAKDLAAPIDPLHSLTGSCANDTLDGSVVGTPAYMPPEQARGEPVDQRADVFAIGAILYHVLVGAAPYVAPSSKDVLDRVLAGPPIAVEQREPGVPVDLVTIVAKAMARDPAERYATAGELAADLKRFQTGQLVAAHHYTRAELFWRWLRRHRLAVGVGVIAIATLAVLGTIGIRQIIAEKDRAETEQRKDEQRRAALLEERGRAELIAGHAGPALVNLVGAARDQRPTSALGFLIADAMRPFEATVATLDAGERNVAAFAPDGALIATGAGNGRVVLWTADGARVRDVDAGHGAILALAWDRASHAFATVGDDGIARVWTRDGQLVRELRGHTGAIGDVAFSSDGQRLVTASADTTASVWTVASGERVVLEGHKGALQSARIDRDGVRVVTASIDGTANVWSAATGTLLTPLRGHVGAIRVALWDATGDRIVTAGVDGTARIWDPDKGKLLVAPLRHDRNSTVESVAWSHDGSRVLTASSDGTARIWELPDPPVEDAMPEPARAIAVLPHTDGVVAATFSADDSWIATAGRVARVWDSRGQPLAAFEHGDAIRSVGFSADATRIVTGTIGATARIWEVTREISPVRTELESPVHAIAIGKDAVIIGTDDSRIAIVGAGAPTILRAHSGRVLALAASPDGTQFASAGEDATAYVWNLGAATPRVTLATSPDAATLAVAWSHDGQRIALGDTAGMLRLWSSDGAFVRATATGEAIVALAFSPRGDVIAGCLANNSIAIWSRNGDLLGTLPVLAARALAFDATGTRLVVGARGAVSVWRFGPGPLPAHVLSLDGPVGDVHAVALGDDGARIVTAGSDGTAKVWDGAKGKLLATRDPHGGSIDAIALSADDATLWTGSVDGTARAWDVHAIRDTSMLADFIARHVPWRLGEDDVVRRASDQQGSDDGKRRSDEE